MERSKDTELICGMMVLVSLEAGLTIKSMVSERTHGLTVGSSKENGKTIICTGKANISGQMVDCTRASM